MLEEKANIGIVGIRDFFLGVETVIDAEFHVRLTRAQPDFANENVFNFDASWLRSVSSWIASRNLNDSRLKRSGHRAEVEQPLAVGSCNRGVFLIRKFDRYRFASVSPTPNRHRLFALQDHVVSKNIRNR